MRKQVIFLIFKPHEIKNFTSNLSSIKDYALLIMYVCRYVLNNADLIKPSVSKDIISYMKIEFQRTKRCFIYIEANKYISFSFPFRYHNNTFWFNEYKVSSVEISEIIGLLNSLDKATTLYSLYLDNGNDTTRVSECVFYITEKLLTTEPGYVRHDFDPSNTNGQIHPIHHFDINFSADATFKLGSYKMFSSDSYEKIFRKDEDCYYVDSFKINRIIKSSKIKHKKKKPKKR